MQDCSCFVSDKRESAGQCKARLENLEWTLLCQAGTHQSNDFFPLFYRQNPCLINEIS